MSRFLDEYPSLPAQRPSLPAQRLRLRRRVDRSVAHSRNVSFEQLHPAVEPLDLRPVTVSAQDRLVADANVALSALIGEGARKRRSNRWGRSSVPDYEPDLRVGADCFGGALAGLIDVTFDGS
jgi:hypothetical protein